MGSYSVIIVDPDKATTDAIKAALAPTVPDLRTSAHALEALTELATRRADLVISALHLPGRDGRWLVDQVARHHRRTRVILRPPNEEPIYGLDHLANVAAIHPKSIGLSTMVRDVQRLASPEPGGAHVPDVRRRAERRTVDSSVVSRLRGGQDCTLIDVSSVGALIETPARVTPGRSVDLQVNEQGLWMTISAVVVRCQVESLTPDRVSYRAGLAFSNPVSTDLFERLAGELAA